MSEMIIDGESIDVSCSGEIFIRSSKQSEIKVFEKLFLDKKSSVLLMEAEPLELTHSYEGSPRTTILKLKMRIKERI